jgi:hypothetical protein
MKLKEEEDVYQYTHYHYQLVTIGGAFLQSSYSTSIAYTSHKIIQFDCRDGAKN